MRERRVKMQKRDEIQGSSWGGGGEWVRTYRPLSLPWAGLVPLPPRSPFALPVSASGSSSAWLQLVGVMRVCVCVQGCDGHPVLVPLKRQVATLLALELRGLYGELGTGLTGVDED